MFLIPFTFKRTNVSKNALILLATPVVYLLDKDKRVIGKKLAHDQVVDIIEKLDSIEKASKQIISKNQIINQTNQTKHFTNMKKFILLTLVNCYFFF